MESEKFKEFIERFSSDKLQKVRVRVLGAYIDQSCLTKLAGKDHLTTFALEADSVAKVKALLDPMGAEVRQVVTWNPSNLITE